MKLRLIGWAIAAVALGSCGRLGFAPTQNQTEVDAAPDAGTDTNTFGPAPAAFSNGTRLRAIRQTVDDVDRLAGWHDMLLDLDCDFAETPAGMRCMPTVVGDTNLSANALCTLPLAATLLFAVQGCGTVPGYYYDRAAKKAHSITRHNGPAYIAGAGTCTLRNAPEIALFDIGPEVPLTMFAASHEERTPGPVFSYIEQVTDDGARYRETTVVNNATGKECDWINTNIDESRCIDAAAYGSLAYTDAACTDEVVLASEPAANVVVQQPTLCDDHPRVLATGAPYTGPLFRREGGACAVFTTTQPAFRLGLEHLADFPRAVRVVGAGTGRVRPSVWRTTTGEEFEDYLLWDTALNAPCYPFVDAKSKKQVCGPVWTNNIAQVFSEPSCSTTSQFVLSDCRERGGARWYPTVPLSGTCDGPGFEATLYGTAGAPTVAYEQQPNGTCTAIDVATHPLRVPSAMFNFDASMSSLVTTMR